MAHTHAGYDPGMVPVPRPAGRPPGDPPGDGARAPDSVQRPAHRLTIADLRHPTEASRFALALVASSVPVAVALFVMVSLGQGTRLIAIMAGIIVGLLLIWVSIQIWRIRLLGDAVLVSAQTLPEVHEVLDVVRSRLHYNRRVDLFVVDKISRVLSADAAPITLTTFFGVHVLVAEGDALGDLSDERERRQLLFTLATYVGALKARYALWASPIFSAFHMTGLAGIVWPFVFPWYRATVYSGDRIAFACCADLDVSLQAVYRSLVGKDVARLVRAEGFTGQALVARRRPLLRFAQLLRPTPHATNRYLNLLAFVRQSDPEAFGGHRPSLRGVGPHVEPVLARLAGKRPHPSVLAIGVCLAFAVLAGGLVVGLAARDSSIARGIAELAGANDDAGNGDTAPATPTTDPPPPTNESALALLALLPESVQGSCTIGASDPSAQLLASVACTPTGNVPEELLLQAYPTADAMTSAFDGYAAGLQSGDCSSGNARSTWSSDGATQGPLACYESTSGHTTVMWGSDSKAVLVLARDPVWSASTMYDWWQNDAPYLQ
jgi:hypothetical protein